MPPSDRGAEKREVYAEAADETELLAIGGTPGILRALMSILIGILTVIEVIVCLLLILIILMQRPRQEGLGAAFGGGVTDQMFGAQTTNVLQKFTGYLAGALFLLTLVLAILTTKVQREKAADGKKLFEAPPPAAAPAVPATPTPGVPASAASAPVAAPAAGAADGKTISVTKQPGATVVVKQPDAKPAAKSDDKSEAKPAATPPTTAPQPTKPAAPAPTAATPPAPKPATPATPAVPPAPAPAKP